MARLTIPQQTPALRDYVRLTDSGTQRVRPDEAAVVLGKMGRELAGVSEASLAERFMVAGLRLATSEVVETLLEAVANRGANTALVAGALRFRGPAIVTVVLGRLYASRDRNERRPFFELAQHLATFPELRTSLIEGLEAALADDRDGEPGRNAIALLAAIGAELPAEALQGLTRSRHTQVRLALTQVVAGWTPSADGLKVLCAMSVDAQNAVRCAAAEGLRQYRMALERYAVTGTPALARAAS